MPPGYRGKKAQNSLKTAHVLFMDLVGYSKVPMEEQDRLIDRLQRVVTTTHQYKDALAKDQVIPLPTGDGMALVFREDPTAAARCALAIAAALRRYPEMQLRMGVNSGPVTIRQDIRGNPNASGAGINFAQRAMDCGEAGHILLTDTTAKDLSHLAAWRDDLHDVGEFTVKHGVAIHLYNLYKAELGNPHSPSPKAASEDPGHYLKILREDSGSIEIRGLQTGNGKVHSIPIQDLYIPLMTAASESRAAESGREPARWVPLQEALQHRLLVILGDPGAGKSTFLKWIVSELAGSEFPILIRVAELATHVLDRKPGDGPTTPHSPAWLKHFLEIRSAENKWRLSGAYFDRKLEDGCLLLLDGLDEASGDHRRQTIAALLQNAAKAYPKSRFVVTSRPQGYTDKTALAGFTTNWIAGLEPEAVKNFLRRWSEAVKLANPRAGAKHFASLWDAVGNRPEILRMAKNPVMLTALAVLHWNNKSIPDQRAELYDSIIDWLSLSHRDRPGCKPPKQCVRLLQRLALAMQVCTEGRKAQVGRHWAAEKLAPEPMDAALEFLEEEEKDSGIIVSRGSDVGFWHLTFQEFLAGKELGGQDLLREKLIRNSRIFSAEWREMVLLLAGVLYEQGEERAGALVNGLLESLSDRASLADQARCVGLVGAIERDLRPFDYSVSDPRYSKALSAVYGIFDGRRAANIDFNVRLEAAEALGQAGDRRLMELDNKIRIEAGLFRMGADKKEDVEALDREGPVHEVYLNTFKIGRYPVTVEEYRKFVEGDGFGDLKEPDEWEEQKLHPNRPVTSVSWHEADAYAKSVGGRLPTEAEWERAARGAEGRQYPWGNQAPDASRANYYASGTRLPTPVGLYPLGATPEGICDMAGNVWEWTADWYDAGYYAHSPRENPKGPAKGDSRAVRGGSFSGPPRDLRGAFRDYAERQARLVDVGFRCVWDG